MRASAWLSFSYQSRVKPPSGNERVVCVWSEKTNRIAIGRYRRTTSSPEVDRQEARATPGRGPRPPRRCAPAGGLVRGGHGTRTGAHDRRNRSTRTIRRAIRTSTTVAPSMIIDRAEPSGQLAGLGEEVLDDVAVHRAAAAADEQRRDVLTDRRDEDQEERGGDARQAERQRDPPELACRAGAEVGRRVEQLGRRTRDEGREDRQRRRTGSRRRRGSRSTAARL